MIELLLMSDDMNSKMYGLRIETWNMAGGLVTWNAKKYGLLLPM